MLAVDNDMMDDLETTERESKRPQAVAVFLHFFLSCFACAFLSCMRVHIDSLEISSLEKILCFHRYLLVR